MVRWGRAVAVAVMIVSVVNWAGWATGQDRLTRWDNEWPPMTPWSALWLFILAGSVLLLAGGARPGLVWGGRLLSAAVTLTAGAFLIELATGLHSRLDTLWFPAAVADLGTSHPGRPSLLAALGVFFLSVTIAVSSSDRRWARRCWSACLAVGSLAGAMAVIAYLFNALALVEDEPSHGIALATAAGICATGAAAAMTRPDRNPIAWFRDVDRGIAARLFGLLLLAFVSAALFHRLFRIFVHDSASVTALTAAAAALVLGAAMVRLSRFEAAALRSLRSGRALLKATADSMLDGQVLLEAVRDRDGQVVDLVYRGANRFACEYLGFREDELVGMRVTQITDSAIDSGAIGLAAQLLADGKPLIVEDIEMTSAAFAGTRRFDVRGNIAGPDLISITWRDVTERYEAQERLAAAERHYRLLAENSADVIVTGSNDGILTWASPSIEAVLGAPPAFWVGRNMIEFIPPEEREAHFARLAGFARGVAFQGPIPVVGPGGVRHWAHVNVKPHLNEAGQVGGVVASLRLIDEEVAAREAAESALRAAAQADARYRHAFDASAAGMALIRADGRLEDVNQAMCELFGYPRHVLLRKALQDLTAAEDRDRSAAAVEDLLAGRDDFFRMTQQYIHADGHRIWGDVTISCVRDESGALDHLLAQVIDITALTNANARSRALARNLQQLTEKLGGELASAAAYMSSIMPHGMTGPVAISSVYLPSRELGGDCFDYVWIDDDHLLVYLLDVSGHGLQPALLAVSIHNVLRSRSLPTETMLSPEQTLETLNRLFGMDSQSDLYFTVWYGVFQNSTGTLRYASAGAPPALLLTGTGTGKQVKPVPLSTPCPPVGIIADTPFSESTYSITERSQLLIFSDGALDLGDEGPPVPIGEFINQVGQLAASPAWSLDQLVHQLQARTATGTLEDDCSLVLLTFE